MVENPEPFPNVDIARGIRAAFRTRAAGGYVARETPRGYEVHGEIARGGMGVIVHAFDRGLTREVALKVLRDELAHEPRYVHRFVEEARITARLDHPGIVPIHEAGRDSAGRAYFAMRLVRGRDLRTIIELANATREGWSQTRALSVFLKVCEAMAYAHEKGVLHRDLKPSNVMVGEFGEVYVMDWGLARVIGHDDAHDLRLRPGAAELAADESPIVTVDGEVLGTPCYMSPEQAQGRLAELGPASDVYAVGAMLYHLLANEMPFVSAGTDVAGRTVLAQLAEGPPRSLVAARRDVPVELVAICERAMAREPARRYPSMLAFAEDLRAYLEGRVVRAFERGAWAEARKWVRRNRALAAALASVVVALAIGLVVSLSLKTRSDANFARAERSARSASEERDRALLVGTFLEDTLGGVSPSVALGRDTTMLREMMDKARARLESGELRAAPEAEARLMLVIGIAYRGIGRYDEAASILDAALQRAESADRGDDKLLARCLSNLAYSNFLRGELEAAELRARRSIELQKGVLASDPESNVELASLADYVQVHASVVQARGDLAGSEDLMREALTIHERLNLVDRPELAINLHNLAVVLASRGKLAEAETCYRRALEILERVHPGDHPRTAGTLDSLGALLGARGDFVGAEALQRRALEMRQRLLPADHPDIATSLNNLASTLRSRGDLQSAESLSREVVEIHRRHFAGDHPILVLSITNLAAMAHTRGDLATAEPLYREALAMQRRLFPGDHPDTTFPLNNLAKLSSDRGDFSGAEELYREALAMQRRLVAGDHEDTARLALNLARVLHQRGQLDEAESLLGETLAMCRSLGPGHERRASAAAVELGQVLVKRKRFAEADRALLEAAAMLEGNDEAARSLRDCVELLVRNYIAWEEAEPGQGHADQASIWKAKLAESTRQ